MGRIPVEIRHKPPTPSHSSLHAGHTSSSNELCQHMPSVVYQGSSFETHCPGLLIGSWSEKQPLHTMGQIQLPEGKHVMNINQIVCIESLGTVRHSYQIMMGSPSKSKSQDDSQGQAENAIIGHYDRLHNYIPI